MLQVDNSNFYTYSTSMCNNITLARLMGILPVDVIYGDPHIVVMLPDPNIITDDELSNVLQADMMEFFKILKDSFNVKADS